MNRKIIGGLMLAAPFAALYAFGVYQGKGVEVTMLYAGSLVLFVWIKKALDIFL